MDVGNALPCVHAILDAQARCLPITEHHVLQQEFSTPLVPVELEVDYPLSTGGYVIFT